MSSQSFLRRALAAALLLLLCTASARADTRVSFNDGWRFRIVEREGDDRTWAATAPTGTTSVTLPHTWNLGVAADHEGMAWYFKTFARPAGTAARHVELQFGATFYKARVFLNGVAIGEHEGGHTAWVVDLTPHLRAVNQLAVAIDNRPGLATIPGWAMKLRDGNNLWYDWWHYGGIVRDVSLRIADTALVRRQAIRTRVASDAATVTTRVVVERTTGGREALRVRAVAIAPDGSVAGTAEAPVAGTSRRSETELAIRVPAPVLWHLDRPALYTMRAEIVSGAAVIDDRTDTFGIRTIEVRDRGLYVNGERVRLSGITRHQESPWEGLAETRGSIRADYDDLKRLQVTFTRPVHYPQHPDVLDYADRNGILLIPEIPIWQFSETQLADPAVLALAKRMMQEMIEEAGNHPSVIGWSTCNESATNTPGGVAYFRAMYDFIKSLDPDRLVSYADDQVGAVKDSATYAAHYADFIMWNQYWGSWHGPASGLVPALDRIDKAFPTKMVVISEFGFAGVHAPDAIETDRQRVVLMREQLAEFARRPWIAGAMFWCYQDYASHRNLAPGLTAGQVDMGLVNEFRQRKPSWEAWRTLNEPAAIALDWQPPTASGSVPAGFRASIGRRPETELPSYPLRGYTAEWELRDHLGTVVASDRRALPEMGTAQVVEGAWKSDAPVSLTLTVRLLRGTGHVAVERTLFWYRSRSSGQDIKDMRLPVPR